MNSTENTSTGGIFPDFFKDLCSWRQLIRISLLFLAVTLPIFFYLRTYDSAMVKITILQLGVLAAFTIWLLGSVYEGRFEIPEKVMPFILPATLLVVWNALRFVLSDYRMAAMDGFIKQEALLISFILALLSFSRRDIRKVIIIILGGWSITVVYGLMQHLGLDPFIWKGAFGERIFSTLGNPNFFADYLLLCGPLALSLACDGENPILLRCVSGALALTGAYLYAWTRGGLGIALFAAATAMFILIAWRTLKDRRRNAAFALSGACAAICLFTFVKFSLPPHANPAASFRSETWAGTLSLIKDQPWLGSGPGSFWVRYPSYRREKIFFIEGKHNNETDHPENEFLEQWADSGAPGVFLWLWLFSVLLYRGWKTLFNQETKEDSIYVSGLFCASVGSVGLMLTSAGSRFAAPGWLIYFIAGLLGVCAAWRPDKPDTVIALPLPLGSSRHILFLPILGIAFFLAYGSIKIFQSDIRHNIAIYYAKSEKWDDAMKEFEKEEPGASAYIMSRYFLGNVYNDRGGPGDYERALQQYREVRSMAPDYVQVHFQEALALERLNRIPEAVEHMERQVRLDPVYEPAWLRLAGLYEKTGDIEKAKSARQKAEAVKAIWAAKKLSK